MTTLSRAAESCRGCELYRDATQTVFGSGPRRARILLLGEQPGDQEDRAGEPFVGPAGKLLDRALAEAGLDEQVLRADDRQEAFRGLVADLRTAARADRFRQRDQGPEILRSEP